MNNLASTLRQQRQLVKAALIQKEVLEIQKLMLGEDHPNIITAMNNLADTLGQ